MNVLSKVTLGSLFSGIGGFEYAAQMYGIEPVWASEIEEPCIRITKRHFPNMFHYGDITKMHGDKIVPVDVISGGSPCQDLSNAGKQSGISRICPECGASYLEKTNILVCPECEVELELSRSGLFLEQIRLIKEMREATNGKYPKIIVWENVFSCTNSNNGDDFWCVLREFCGLLGEEFPTFRPKQWSKSGEILGKSGSLAWRTLDAQYWGVPQRRRRIFLVADLRGQGAGEILFKPESLRRHPPKSKGPWERIAGEVKSSLRAAGKADAGEVKPLAIATQQVNAEVVEDKSPTLTAANGTSGSNKVYVVLDDKPKDSADKEVYGICSMGSNCMKSDNPNSGFYKADVAKTLDTSGANPSCNQGGNVVVEDPVYCIQGNCIDRADTAGCNGKGWKEDIAYTLTTIDRPAVAYSVHENQRGAVWLSDVSSTITTGGGKPGQGYPCVLEESPNCGAFLGKQGTTARSIGYSEKVSPTLTTGEPPQVVEYNDKPLGFPWQAGGSNPHMSVCENLSPTLIKSQTMAVLVENHPADSRVKISEDNVCQTLSARMGTGGGNVPLVMEEPMLIDVHSQDCRWSEVKSGVCPTLTAAMGMGGNNTPFVVEPESKEPIVMGSTGSQMYWDEGISGTLCSSDYKQNHKVIMVDGDSDVKDEPVIAASKASFFTRASENDVAECLVATDYKDPQIVLKPRSIVRRLTPTECTRLQGFPDGWLSGESDAAQYKALGNSVAVPCVAYIMSGIIDVLDPI